MSNTITSTLLKLIITDQHEEHVIPVDYYKRTYEKKLSELASNKEIVVLTGLRRSGKSVLLQYIRQELEEKDFYINFEDERLSIFETKDFQILYESFIELFGVQKTFYFDEIQNIPGWEKFVRRLYNSGNKIFITGSNANLFSEELGTRLTGRYISQNIYPFSYQEYLQEKFPEYLGGKITSTIQIGKMKKIFNEYTIYGGIPEYLKNKQIEYLHSLYVSILYRDIVARYKINNVTALKQLVFFLASNCSKEITYNSLRKMLGVGSVTTVSDFCGYLERSYLCFFLNRYSESVKSQQQSPKKIYFIDHALAKILGFRFSEDKSRMLENIVFIELKRRGFELYYHRETKECDFVVRQNGKTVNAIQVSHDMSDVDTRTREVNGLLEALHRFSLKQGHIITLDGESIVEIKQYKIVLIPIWKWLISE